MRITAGYLVSTCGCTDCFPTALFFNADQAHKWAKAHANPNPEGFTVQEIDVSSLGLHDD